MSKEIPATPDADIDHDNPAWRNTIARRIVEITDEDENLVPEFISVDTRPVRFNR